MTNCSCPQITSSISVLKLMYLSFVILSETAKFLPFAGTSAFSVDEDNRVHYYNEVIKSMVLLQPTPSANMGHHLQ